MLVSPSTTKEPLPLFVEGQRRMMDLLVTNISSDVVDGRLAHREAAIPVLPMKLGTSPNRLMHPFGTPRLHMTHQINKREIGGEPQQEVYVLRHPVDFQWRRLEISSDPSDE
jgi:hypothetical protein